MTPQNPLDTGAIEAHARALRAQMVRETVAGLVARIRTLLARPAQA